MVKSLASIVITWIGICGCFLNQKVHTNQKATTTKIRVTTHLHGKDLQKAYIMTILKAGFDLAQGDNPMATKPRVFENYYVEVFVSFDDSIATISGNAGDVGLNGLRSSNVTANQINWSPIVENGRGWWAMYPVGQFDNAINIQNYNTN